MAPPWLEDGVSAVVLVEGASDEAALRALAERLGLDLDAAGVALLAIGGAHSVGRVLAGLRAARPGLTVAGLCDAAEAGLFGRALETVDGRPAPSLAELERLGFHVCAADLEEELIRAVGTEGVERVIERMGELRSFRSFRSFQRQPAQRSWPPEAQLRRFLGTHSGRKALYARALVQECEPARIPRPLRQALASATAGA